MAGLLTHLFVGFLCALIVHVVHLNWKYSFAVLFGNLLPDIIKFGIVAIRDRTLDVYRIARTDLFRVLEQQSSLPTNWLALGFFIFGVTAFLFHYHMIRKKTMEDYDLLYVFLILGVFLHLILDVMILETSPWI